MFTWTTTHRGMPPAFVETPFTLVVVELEGPRVITAIEGIGDAEPETGMPVEVCFDAIDDDLGLPRFRDAS